MGYVKVVDGQAFIIRNDMRTAAAVGDFVRPGDVLETDENGSLGVTLRDSALLSLGPQSRIVLDSYAFNRAEQDYSLFGRILHGTFTYLSGDVGAFAPDNVQIETPFGIIGIRGTQFAVSVPWEAAQ